MELLTPHTTQVLGYVLLLVLAIIAWTNRDTRREWFRELTQQPQDWQPPTPAAARLDALCNQDDANQYRNRNLR